MRWRDVKQKKIAPKTPDDPKELRDYATLYERFKAFMTDSFLLAMPIFYGVIYLVFDGLKGSGGVESHRLEAWAIILIPLGILVVWFLSQKGQTPGMKAYEIRAIDNQSGEKPSPTGAFLRYFFFNIAFFSVILLLVPLFRKDRRGVQDLFSGTSLIKA